ncbi:MAG: hypothetical protein ACTHJ3_01085 [Pararhizobium sp.]
MSEQICSIPPSGLPAAQSGNAVSIAGTDVRRITYKDEPVVSLAMVDEVHQRPNGTAGRNFRENRHRFVQAEDFIVGNLDEMRRAFPGAFPSRGGGEDTLLTRRGYLKLTKPMNDDRAWAVQGEMIDRYFAVEAANSMTPAELLLEQAKMMVEVERRQRAVETEQVEQAKRIATTERRLDQIETATDPFTCVGYARWAKQTSIDLKDAADLGRRATRRCNDLGIKVTKIPDPRFGAVNQFPKAILDEVWAEKFGRSA